GVGGMALTGAGLLLLPAVLQSPVTAPVLIDDASRAFTENLRFYYAASAGLALLLGAGYASLHGATARRAMFVACLLCAGYAGVSSQRLGTQWAQAWSAQSTAYLVLGAELGQHQFPSGCRIYLDAPQWTDAFRHHADTIVKAGAPVAAPVQACAIFAGALV